MQRRSDEAREGGREGRRKEGRGDEEVKGEGVMKRGSDAERVCV